MKLRLVVEPCEALMEACDMAQHYADLCCCDVEFEFNSIRCVAEPNGDGKILAERQAEAQNAVFVVRSRNGGTVCGHSMSERPKTFAWTPGQEAYTHFPPYLNIRENADGTLTVTVRGREQPDAEFYSIGDTAIIELPPGIAAELRAFFASVDTHPKGGDAQQGSVSDG